MAFDFWLHKMCSRALNVGRGVYYADFEAGTRRQMEWRRRLHWGKEFFCAQRTHGGRCENQNSSRDCDVAPTFWLLYSEWKEHTFAHSSLARNATTYLPLHILGYPESSLTPSVCLCVCRSGIPQCPNPKYLTSPQEQLLHNMTIN
jgi:hypothetical protein